MIEVAALELKLEQEGAESVTLDGPAVTGDPEAADPDHPEEPVDYPPDALELSESREESEMLASEPEQLVVGEEEEGDTQANTSTLEVVRVVINPALHRNYSCPIRGSAPLETLIIKSVLLSIVNEYPIRYCC